MRKRLALALVLSLSACDGDTGPAGPAGPAGGDGTPGANGNDIILSAKAKHGFDISPVAVDVTGKTAAEIEQIGQGSYIVNALGGCDTCHTPGPGMYLAGNVRFSLEPATLAPVNVVFSRNLTPDAQTGLALTEDQFIAVLRTGEDFLPGQEGEALNVMPWYFFRWMGIDDIKAVYAYLKVIPAVNNAVSPDVKGTFFGALTPVPYTGTTYNFTSVERPLPAELDGSGNLIPDPDHIRRGLAIHPIDDLPGLESMSPTDQAAFARGSYLANIGHCALCHSNPSINFGGTGAAAFDLNITEHLTGGGINLILPEFQPFFRETRTISQNLLGATNGLFNQPGMSLFAFEEIIATSTKFDGEPVGFPMNLYTGFVFKNMLQSDQIALFTYLSTVAAVQGLGGATDKVVQLAARYCTVDGDCLTGETCHVDATVGNECVGGGCSTDLDCGACQTCSGGACVAPVASSACLAGGF